MTGIPGTPNIEGLDVVSIETDLLRKGHCQRFFSEKRQKDYRRGAVRQEQKKAVLLSIFIQPPQKQQRPAFPQTVPARMERYEVS